MCPRCGQNAPVVYRGLMAYCTACGAPRPPLTGKALNLAGQTSRVGGAVARVLGWVILSVGLAIALIAGVGAQLLFPGGFAGAVIGLPIATLSLVLGIVALRGGTRLGHSGSEAEKGARTQAVYALAAHRGGALTPLDVAQALDVRVEEADALLSGIAREHYEQVGVDVDANGTVVYRFNVPTRVRVDPEVDPEIAGSPNRDEWERLETQEAAAAGTSRVRAPR